MARRIHPQWKLLAAYMGCRDEEIRCIENSYPMGTLQQMFMFLRVFWIPSCGERTGAIFEETGRRAGIMDEVKPTKCAGKRE